MLVITENLGLLPSRSQFGHIFAEPGPGRIWDHETWLESCAVVSNKVQRCCSLFSCMNEYLAVDSGGCLRTKN